ncbi:MAG TPA: glycine zipper domain-containing protein [Chthoniobacteraceae bacterium]|jgi:hypothetical protein
MKKLIPLTSTCLLAIFSFTACETSGGNALAGAATGAVIGGFLHGRGSDAFHGAAIGAGAGYLIGKVVRREREARYERYDRERDYEEGDERYEEERVERRYPVGRRTNRPGFVTSPYPPFHLIDVRGIPRGAQVLDPSCDRVFIKP